MQRSAQARADGPTKQTRSVYSSRAWRWSRRGALKGCFSARARLTGSGAERARCLQSRGRTRGASSWLAPPSPQPVHTHVAVRRLAHLPPCRGFRGRGKARSEPRRRSSAAWMAERLEKVPIASAGPEDVEQCPTMSPVSTPVLFQSSQRAATWPSSCCLRRPPPTPPRFCGFYWGPFLPRLENSQPGSSRDPSNIFKKQHPGAVRYELAAFPSETSRVQLLLETSRQAEHMQSAPHVGQKAVLKRKKEDTCTTEFLLFMSRMTPKRVPFV